MRATAELPSLAIGLASHVRIADVGVADIETVPSVATSVSQQVPETPVAPGSGRLSGAWLLDVPSDDEERASRISDLVLQRARQGRRFA